MLNQLQLLFSSFNIRVAGITMVNRVGELVKNLASAICVRGRRMAIGLWKLGRSLAWPKFFRPCFSLAGYQICKKWRRDSRVRPARWPRPSRDRLVNTSISRPDSQKTNGSFSPTQNLVVPYTCTIEFCHETIRKSSTPTITLAFFGDSVLLKTWKNERRTSGRHLSLQDRHGIYL